MPDVVAICYRMVLNKCLIAMTVSKCFAKKMAKKKLCPAVFTLDQVSTLLLQSGSFLKLAKTSHAVLGLS